MEIKIIVKKTRKADLKRNLEEAGIEIERDDFLLGNHDLKSGFDVATTISIVIGTATFWTALASVLKQAITKEPIEIEFTDKETGKLVKVKANSTKELENTLFKIKEYSKNNSDEDPS